MKKSVYLNSTLLTDFYELTMANGYFVRGFGDQEVCFDMFFRSVPDGGGYAIMAGVEQLIDYLKNLNFDQEDIEYLRSKKCFSEDFLQYLLHFKFVCDVWAIPEGTPIFPGEPIVTVRGPVIQAQFIETMLLLLINHQSLIATKANRVCRAAQGRAVMEFGSRRAQGGDGAVLGARAAYIGGCAATACAMADRDYGIPATGTMAHSWVMMFDSEYEAFRAYAEEYPDNCTLLIDTYSVLKSGLPNAIRVFREVLEPKGYRPKGIRIDSGDLAYLSREVRRILDREGFPDCKIVVSNALDEFIIKDLLSQHAPIDSFGVGERLITSRSEPVFGGVYKLSGVMKDGELIPKLKLSENVGKMTTPGFKSVWRLFDNATNHAIADVVTLHEEEITNEEPYLLFDPEHVWKSQWVDDFHAVRLPVQIFRKGECCYETPDIHDIQNYCRDQVATLWDEVLRFENPHKYYVDLSKPLWDIKNDLITQARIASNPRKK
ncbi:MAG: nicotinate phosphoribosyltransferase [Clostridiaceae bacterium]|nr:nicotinate phosphoribosyltransferase [Clostridiaceae bacterium]MDD6273493.1 nicotinate phosphoribosyltransferase [Clostridiaceae bacterium]